MNDEQKKKLKRFALAIAGASVVLGTAIALSYRYGQSHTDWKSLEITPDQLKYMNDSPQNQLFYPTAKSVLSNTERVGV